MLPFVIFLSLLLFCFFESCYLWIILITYAGKDKSVVLWSIQDHISASASVDAKSPGVSSSIVKTSKDGENNEDSPAVAPRGIFHGHENTVEDVQFSPSR